MLARKALAGTAAGPKVYVEDVFSTYLYTGNGSTQTITNGIDLSGEGGLTWIKSRGVARNHRLTDTVRGATKILISNTTDAEQTESNGLTAFNNNGFSVGDGTAYNSSSENYASWTFRQAKKFFDVVTFTQSGTSGWQAVSHNLGSVPGCIIFKNASTTASWPVYHRYNAAKKLLLDSTSAEVTETIVQNLTSTSFEVSITNIGNNSGDTFVAYLFAHDAGGFGDSGSDNVISCGSFTTDGSGNATVSLGYEPQWLLTKSSSGTSSWMLLDNMRGWVVGAGDYPLYANLTNAEGASTSQTAGDPTATGFTTVLNPSATYIYIAIRRGPMKTPETGTSVFDPVLLVDGSTNLPPVNSTINAPDLAWSFARNAVYGYGSLPRDRLSSAGISYLETSSTAAEASYAGNTFGFTRLQKGIDGANANSTFNQASPGVIYWMFGRAPGFFDVVCYTGTGSARTVSHNLGVAPELMIVKSRSNARDWAVYSSTLGATKNLYLNVDNPAQTSSTYWNDTAPTTTVFSVKNSGDVNLNTATFVAYLFASLSGVSKVGSYTGNGSSVTVTTNFQPRFILVKRTDDYGDWIVSDSARGLVAGDDPFLKLNSTAAEVTNEDWVDISSTSFTVNQTTNNANVNTGTYLYLAIS